MGVLRRVCIGAAVWAAAGAASAQAPAYPTSLDEPALTAWLKRETDITPRQVVAISPSAVTAVISIYATAEPPGARVVVRSEAVSPEAYARDGVLSWHVSVSVDCARRLAKLGETTGYPGRNLLGGSRVLRPAESDWRAPAPGTPLDNIWRTACERGFKRPLGGASEAVALPPPPPARAAPERAPAASPPRPVARGGSSAVVQVSASGSEAQASADLAALTRKFGPAVQGLTLKVERAEVGGRTVFRAVVTGFADPAAARRFCEQLKGGGQACFVRAS